MPKLQQALFKHLPEQVKPGKSDFNLKPAAVDQWFDSLPLANIRISTKDIYNAIKESNGITASYKKRLYFLEKIHEPVMDLANNLRRLTLNRDLPLSEKHQRIAILVRKLHEQTAIGYKLVLSDLLNCKLFFLCSGRNKLMAQVIERIIRHHSLSLISAYQLYHSPYKGLWSDLHKLFLLAVKEKLLKKKVTDPSLIMVSETTIKNAYLQVLLVAVADPYRMSQHHIYSVFRQLEEWAPLADIKPYNEEDDRDNLFVSLSGDKHPTFINPGDTQQNNQNHKKTWTLDTSKLDYAHLLEHFNSQENQTTEINVNILKQLSLSWGIVPNRAHSRRPAKSRLKVAIGLNNVHYVLNGYADPEWLNKDEAKTGYQLTEDMTDTGASFHSKAVEPTIKVNDIWGEVFTSKSLLNKDKQDQEEVLNNGSTETSNAHNHKYWSMVNESIGGYCLLWDQRGTVNAKVGEIIAVSNDKDKKEGYWFIGTIRWIKCNQSDKIQIGVQILAPNAIAVSTAKYSSMREGIKSRAILLPVIPVLNQPKTLITTGLGYEVGDQVMLYEYRLVNANITSVKTKVVLQDTLEVTPHFSRFKYQSADEFYGTSKKTTASPQEEKDDTLSLDGDSEFDSIWDDL